MHYDPDAALARLRAADRMVVGQLGQSLDGRVATVTGESLYINGRCALTHLHRLRAAVDAVVVGASTVALDNPRLTVRLAEGETPLRVIIDPTGRVPADSQCFQDDAGPVLVIHAANVVPIQTLPDHMETVALQPDDSGRLAMADVMALLSRRAAHKVLIEGGPRTLSLAVEAGIVDELHVMVAPMLLGSGKPGFTLPAIDKLSDALRPKADTWSFEDGDVLFACRLREQREAVDLV